MRIERKRPSIYEALLLRSPAAAGNAPPHALPAVLFLLAASVLLGGSVFVVRQIATAASVKANVGETAGAFLRNPGATSESSKTDDGDSLQVAWLMSFPNSGTSYTSELVRTATRQKTASNYRSEDAGATVAVFEDSPSGPFWTEFEDEETAPELPTSGYLLTKTHCGGYCVQCSPVDYMESPLSFVQHCVEGDTVKDGNGETRVDSYSRDLVKRAVHVIRSPFDNVVSRFHLARKEHKKFAVYPSTREGFRAFCASLGERFHEQEQAYGEIFTEEVQAIPCHAEFFRYIQWHDLAFLTAWDLNLPTHILHYEDYTNNFNETKDKLLEFLQQEAVREPPVFVTGKTYRHYFSEEEIQAVLAMFSKLAFRETMEHTKHYFE